LCYNPHVSIEPESSVLQKLKTLELQPEHYIVVGSGILDALGIRRAHDIDFVTTPETFERLRKMGWTSISHPDRESLNKDDFEAYLGWDNPDEQPNFADLMMTKEVIGGYNFVPLARVVDWKRRHAREKDLKDLQLIDRYLEEN